MDSGAGGYQNNEPENRATDEIAPEDRVPDERAPDFGIGKITNESVMKELFYREEHKGQDEERDQESRSITISAENLLR